MSTFHYLKSTSSIRNISKCEIKTSFSVLFYLADIHAANCCKCEKAGEQMNELLIIPAYMRAKCYVNKN